jgi:hypothetical protein
MRILRRLIRVLRVGLCARAGAFEGGPRRYPPSLKSPNAILELSDACFAWIFGPDDDGLALGLRIDMKRESMFSPSRDEYGKAQGL